MKKIKIEERIPIIALRALAFTKGIRIVARKDFDGWWKDHHYPLFKKYGADPRKEKVKIKAHKGVFNKKPQDIEFDVLSLDSNKELREKARLDLVVLEELQKTSQTSLLDLKRQLKRRGIKSSLLKLRQSLKRVHLIGQTVGRIMPAQGRSTVETKVYWL